MGSIWTSADSGFRWTESSGDSPQLWRGIAASSDGTKLAAVVSKGNIWTSSDAGQSWTENIDEWEPQDTYDYMYDYLPLEWSDIASSSEGTRLAAVAAGGGGNAVESRGLSHKGSIWTSTDSGRSWPEMSTALPKATSYAIASSSDGTKLAALVGHYRGDVAVAGGASPIFPSTAPPPWATGALAFAFSLLSSFLFNAAWFLCRSAPCCGAPCAPAGVRTPDQRGLGSRLAVPVGGRPLIHAHAYPAGA